MNQSSSKGLGMNFSEVREYHFGDETRFIDWNVTARYNNPHVKVFEEDREHVNVFFIDVSGSLDFGEKNITRYTISTRSIDPTDCSPTMLAARSTVTNTALWRRPLLDSKYIEVM